MDRIEGYLSRVAQGLWPDALVICRGDREWIIQRNGQPDMGLGDNFGAANQALHALVRAERARRGGG
jgi:hypothetical protein